MERRAPQIPFLSNVTGTWITAAEATDPAYWRRHLRQPVRFAPAAQELLQNTSRVFVEVGPGRTLASLMRQQGDAAQGRTILTSLRHPQETQADLPFALQTLGRLWQAGVSVDWQAFSSEERRLRIPLPTYPFERQRYWIDAPAADATPVRTSRRLVKNADMASWFYAPSWTRAALDKATPHDQVPGPWLVFADDRLSVQLVERLRRDGQTVVMVRPGERFGPAGPDLFAMVPGAPDGYRSLMAELAATGRFPTRVVHAWSVGQPSAAANRSEAFDRAQDRGFFSVLFLVQAIVQQGRGEAMDLTVVGDELCAVRPADVVSPEKTPVLGLCLTIPQEHAEIRCSTVDVERSPANGVAAVVEMLRAELLAGTRGASVAYRGAQRWVQTWEPATVASEVEISPLRQAGVYVITGGLGNIGLTIAERLAGEVRARLVLVGRSTPPPRDAWPAWLETHAAGDPVVRQIEAVRALEARGAEVLLVSADVSNLDQMKGVFARAVQRFGAVHGVFHAAGTIRQGIEAIQSLDRRMCELQFQPKVRGLYVLEQAVADLPLDFVLVTSSLSSLLGGLGYGAYAAANRFLDGFVDRQHGVGAPAMAEREPRQLGLRARSRRNGARRARDAPAEGVESLVRVLADRSLSRVAVSTGDLDARLDRYVRKAAGATGRPRPGRTRHARPELATSFAAPDGEIEETIADVWRGSCSASNGSAATTTSSTWAATRCWPPS